MGNIADTRDSWCSRTFEYPFGSRLIWFVASVVDLRRQCDPGTIDITPMGRRRTDCLHLHSPRRSTRSTMSAQSTTGLSTFTCRCHRQWRRHRSISCVCDPAAQRESVCEREDLMEFLDTKFFSYWNSTRRCPTWWSNSASIVSFDGRFESNGWRMSNRLFLLEFHLPFVLEIMIVQRWCV